MMKSYLAYVDEAGDEGFGKLRQAGTIGQSRWLSLGAAIVSKENDRFIPSWRDEIVNLFPKRQSRDLHFRHLNHDQRVAACAILSSKPMGICVVSSNKETLLDSPKMEVFKRKGYLYNYLVRFLLERVTETVARLAQSSRQEAQLHIIFSRRAGTDYQSMKEYLHLMRDGREALPPVRSINWDVLHPNSVSVENHSIRAGLQIADVVTSATYSAIDPNQFGHTEPRYAMILRSRYIRRNGRALNCGITIIPPIDKSPLTEAQKEFLLAVNKK